MKKILLSGLMLLGLSALVNAQSTITVYNGTAAEDSVNGTPYDFTCAGFTHSQATTGAGATAGNDGTYWTMSGSTSAYYICGVGNAKYDGPNQAPFGYSGTSLSTDKLAFSATTNNTSSKVKVQFSTTATPVKTFGYEFDFSADAAVKAGWTHVELTLDQLKEIVANNPTGPAPTLAEVQDFGKIEIVLVCTDNSGVCTGELNIDNIKIGSISSTKNTANLIATSKLYPNPVSDLAKVEMTLKSVSDVKVTLSDLMGKEIMTITEGTMSSVDASFDVSNLKKGVYSVNYSVNGEAAKAELLMVK